MKKIYTITLMVLGLTFAIQAQNIGNIYVSENISATMVFEKNVEFVVFGNNPVASYDEQGNPIFKFYEMYLSKNTVILRVADKTAPYTNITIKLEGGDVLYGMVQINETLAQSFFDFRTKVDEKEKEQKEEIKTGIDLVRFRVAQVVEMPDEYSWIGVRKSGMEFQVGVIRNDESHMYIKIIVRNNSGAKFNIDGAIFRFEENKGKGLSKKGNQVTERVVPVHHSEIEAVDAYSEKTMGYALPLFAIGENGALIIQFIEKNGTRNATIEIPSSELLKVKIFPNKL